MRYKARTGIWLTRVLPPVVKIRLHLLENRKIAYSGLFYPRQNRPIVPSDQAVCRRFQIFTEWRYRADSHTGGDRSQALDKANQIVPEPLKAWRLWESLPLLDSLGQTMVKQGVLSIVGTGKHNDGVWAGLYHRFEACSEIVEEIATNSSVLKPVSTTVQSLLRQVYKIGAHPSFGEAVAQ
jgi:hypothetical protein